MLWLRIILSIYFCCVNSIFAWDTRELELFDLVEEVNRNFYEILGLQQEATVIDIRKAYRKMSLQLHPDKNKDRNAEENNKNVLFAIYEVLKDLEKRRIYDNILLNGLPTWKQSVYYYRHVRKMSLLEFTIFLFLLATGAQYLFAWSVYIEKKYELEDILSAKFKKKEKKLKKFKNFEDFNTDAIMAEINLLPKPKYQDLLPFKLCDYFIYCIKSTPGCYQKWRDLWMQVRLEDDISEHDSQDETEERIKKPRHKKVFEIPEFAGEYSDLMEPLVNDTRPEPPIIESRTVESNTWTDEQLVILICAINKYLGGVTNRWEKIAHFVGRSVLEVVTAAKQLKANTDSAVSISTSVQGITGTLNEHVEVKKKKKGALSEEMLERQIILDNWREHSPRGVAKEEYKAAQADKALQAANEANLSSGVWNQKQQKALESALSLFAKGSGERWEKIAGCVPGKTKDECLMRYKELAEVVRKKRQSVASVK
uniref:DnaJ homolog subfamily C member 1 n=1 Tax=Strigamia maritima TaxID=126957 RepID=T1IJ68_STRMM